MKQYKVVGYSVTSNLTWDFEHLHFRFSKQNGHWEIETISHFVFTKVQWKMENKVNFAFVIFQLEMENWIDQRYLDSHFGVSHHLASLKMGILITVDGSFADVFPEASIYQGHKMMGNIGLCY